MICPVCKQRWAPIARKKTHLRNLEDMEREKVFHNNVIVCCGDQDCLEIICFHIQCGGGESYNEMVEDTKKELSEGRIK